MYCTFCNVHCIIPIGYYPMYIVQCTIYNVHCTIYISTGYLSNLLLIWYHLTYILLVSNLYKYSAINYYLWLYLWLYLSPIYRYLIFQYDTISWITIDPTWLRYVITLVFLLFYPLHNCHCSRASCIVVCRFCLYCLYNNPGKLNEYSIMHTKSCI